MVKELSKEVIRFSFELADKRLPPLVSDRADVF